MAYRRSVGRRRTRRPVRRLRRRTTRVSRMRLRGLISKVHHFKRTFTLTPLASSTATSYGAYNFQFQELPNYTEFQNLYDCYRINKIVMKFVPNHNSSEFGSTKAMCEFNSVLDFNDVTVPTALTQLYEYQNWRMTRGNRIHTRMWTPSVLTVISTTSATNYIGDAPKYKQWLNTSQADIEHYGLKYAFGATNAAGDVYFTPYITVYFSCKSVK